MTLSAELESVEEENSSCQQKNINGFLQTLVSNLFGAESRVIHQTGFSTTLFDQLIADKATAELFNYLFPVNV